MLPSNFWNSPVIRKRLYQEAGFETAAGISAKNQYFFIAPFPDSFAGDIFLRNYSPGPIDPDPHEMQIEFSRSVRNLLQSNCGHDGYWLVGWTHPPETYESIRIDGDNCWNRMAILWADSDGDFQFCFDSDIPFIEMFDNGDLYYVNMLETAWNKWNEDYGKRAVKDDLGIHQDQLGKPALEALKQI